MRRARDRIIVVVVGDKIKKMTGVTAKAVAGGGKGEAMLAG